MPGPMTSSVTLISPVVKLGGSTSRSQQNIPISAFLVGWSNPAPMNYESISVRMGDTARPTATNVISTLTTKRAGGSINKDQQSIPICAFLVG